MVESSSLPRRKPPNERSATVHRWVSLALTLSLRYARRNFMICA